MAFSYLVARCLFVGAAAMQHNRRLVEKTSPSPCVELEGKTDLSVGNEWCNGDDARNADETVCGNAYIIVDGERFLCTPKFKWNGDMKKCVSSKVSVESSGCTAPSQGCLLPLGDSITQAYVGRTGYRYRLWKKLVTAGLFFDWVGTQTEHKDKGWTEESDPHSQDFLNPDYENHTFPRQNEGHSGWRTDEVAGNLSGWLSTYPCQPTCVLVHLGTNDMVQDESVASTLDDIREVIDILKDSGSDPTILLAVPIPTCGKRHKELGPEIPSLADPDRKVFIVETDVPAGTFSKKDDCFDYCHPNDSGEQKLANHFFEAVQTHCVAS